MTLHCYLCLTAFILYSPRGAQGNAEITTLAITSNVSIRFADVNVTSTVVNSGKTGEEISFEVQMPTTAFVSRFSIFVNGEEFKGEIKENKDAYQIFSAARENNEATGLVTRQARMQDNFDYEMFKVQVFTPGESKVEFHLQYQELLERHLGVYSQWIHIRPKQIVPELNVVCYYNEPQGFQSFTYKLPTRDTGEVRTEFTDYTRKIIYTPSAVSQIAENPDTGLDDTLSIEYDVIHDTDGGIVVENEDHFTHFFSPECQNELILSKRIVFIIDKSGSMESPRIDYVKTALRAILSQLRPTDSFNLVTFDDIIFKWKGYLVDASPNNINDAIHYTDSINANGATNINTALLEGIRLFKARNIPLNDDRKSNVIVFLTDGMATKGETNRIRIRESVADENTKSDGELVASIFSLAFGVKTNADFLKRLAWSNGGAYTPIRTGEDAGSLLLNFFEQVQNPYLNDVRFEYESDGEESRSVSLTRNEFPQYFCGSELVVSGQLEEMDSSATNGDGELSDDEMQLGVQPRVYAKSNRSDIEFVASRKINVADTQKQGFLSRIYVYKKIQDLLQQAEVETGIDNDLKRQLEAQALNLSLTYGFVTKLTSMVVRSVKAPDPIERGSVKNRAGSFGTRDLVDQAFDLFGDETTTDLSTTPVEMPDRNGGRAHSVPVLRELISLCSSLLLVLWLRG